MAALKFHKVTTLPGSLEADAFYFVQNSSFAESYVTDSAGTARSIGNTGMIEAVAGAQITTALADLNTVEIVADIPARDALTTSLSRNAMILVIDASADTSVGSGAALYAYRDSDSSTIKIAEYESMDVELTWESISGRPTSAPTLLDDAVSKRHSHANKATIDKLGETGGKLTFDGSEVSANWGTQNW